jgi:hypothetical protein
MKLLVPLLTAWCAPALVCAQFGGEHIINMDSSVTENFILADMDGDGDLDAMSATGPQQEADSNLFWYENAGDGVFIADHPVLPSTHHVHWCAAGDLDNDGLNDIVIHRGFEEFWTWEPIGYCHNLGGGVFGPLVTLGATVYNSPVWTEDVDDDGDVDIVRGGDEPCVFRNNGGFSFTEEPWQTIPTADACDNFPVRVYDAYFADMDGDGDRDVTFIDGYCINLYWIANDGHGHFTTTTVLYDGGGSCQRIAPYDLDGDGDLDILGTNACTANALFWFENLGAGVFGPSTLFSTYTCCAVPWTPVAFDVDHNGLLDPVFVNLDWQIVWMKNMGDWSFEPQFTGVLTSNLGGSLQLADLTGTTDPELVYGGSLTHLRWMGSDVEHTSGLGPIGTVPAQDVQFIGDELTLRIPGACGVRTLSAIMDMAGHRFTPRTHCSDGAMQVDLSGFATGAYVASFMEGGQLYRTRFMIAR